VQSEREALVTFFEQSGLRFARIGLEAGPLSQWLHARLVEAGLPAICIETRHVKAVLKAMTVKTDKNDARGMAQLMRMGWFRPVHVKAPVVQENRGAADRAQTRWGPSCGTSRAASAASCAASG
jgi:transposase